MIDYNKRRRCVCFLFLLPGYLLVKAPSKSLSEEHCLNDQTDGIDSPPACLYTIYLLNIRYLVAKYQIFICNLVAARHALETGLKLGRNEIDN